MSLFWRVFVTNAALLVVAAIVLGVSPITVRWPIALTEAVVLTFGLVAMLVANALLLRPAFQPLERLARRMGDVDLLRPGQRFAVAARGEILALVAAFNQMLERLEAERRESGRRAVAAQEAERKRVASELHDEVGQAMTGVLMLLARLQDAVVPELLKLDRDVELALYRIVQESLTNVARHAGATRVELSMGPRQGGVGVRVVDDGRGVHGPLREGGGVRGMRERAMVVGGELAITAARAGGVEVRVNVPALEER